MKKFFPVFVVAMVFYNSSAQACNLPITKPWAGGMLIVSGITLAASVAAGLAAAIARGTVREVCDGSRQPQCCNGAPYAYQNNTVVISGCTNQTTFTQCPGQSPTHVCLDPVAQDVVGSVTAIDHPSWQAPLGWSALGVFIASLPVNLLGYIYWRNPSSFCCSGKAV